ncbi:Prefoldin [Cylindrobasidium torrendii FP15055 ss-10]|uniref:Prefoldin n=1 Tax=Cylindrobasidium torrendii FP15055 ss-10 TaxID=1314674 RepID=A0A0D7B6S7_9AGAR|nr:Prefoldin [Cylindrobasidium torrendii FP15055 ss-10]
MARAVEAREKLGTQQAENETVKAEFQKLKPENAIYKLIGPVLVKQEQSEAKTNVDTRLSFITSEIKRVEGQIKEVESKAEEKKAEIIATQTALQQTQQPPA